MMQKNKLLFSSILVLILVTILSSATVFAEATDSWTLKTAMNEARRLHQVAVVNDKIYVIGGYAAGKAEMKTVEEYDLQTNVWTAKASMNIARYGHKAVVVNGKIYVLGGSNTAAIKSVEEYDPETDKWTTKADMLSSRSGYDVAVVGNKIYVIGGTSPNGVKVDEYDPSSNTWISKAEMSTARYYHRAAVVDDIIYVTGGAGLKTVEAYNPASNVWTTKASMSDIRFNHELAVVNGKIYAINGSSSVSGTQSTINSVEEYNPQTDTWTTKTSTVDSRDQFQLTVVNNKICVIGGRIVTSNNVSKYLNTVEEYDADTNTWTSIAPMNVNRSCGSPVPFYIGVVGNTIYATGGYDDNSKDVSSVEAYTVGGSSTNEPDTPVITGNSGILELTMTNGTIKEYDLSAAELQNFLTWYDGRANSGDKAYYIFTKKNNIKPFLSRKEYISFDKISSCKQSSKTSRFPPQTIQLLSIKN